MNLGFIASGSGTNMQSIIDACKTKQLEAKPVIVISNNSKSGALERAKAEKIPFYHISEVNCNGLDGVDSEILSKLITAKVDIVILAGYMKKIGPKTLSHFQNRILNIHPALLPKHGGIGMYGINVHKSVLMAGETETGVTIHIVDNNYDKGRILSQEKVDIEKGDTPETLSKRVLKVEHKLYVNTLAKIFNGEIKL